MLCSAIRFSHVSPNLPLKKWFRNLFLYFSFNVRNTTSACFRSVRYALVSLNLNLKSLPQLFVDLHIGNYDKFAFRICSRWIKYLGNHDSYNCKYKTDQQDFSIKTYLNYNRIDDRWFLWIYQSFYFVWMFRHR